MPLPASGSISLSQVNVELNRPATQTISMNDAAVRTLFGAGGSGTTISKSQGYGKSNRVTVNLTISANTANYTLNTAKVTGYAAGTTDVILTINSGVTVFSSSTGTAALIVDTSWAAGDTVRINNNGTILGRGGNGANAAVSGAAGNPGAAGGLGLLVQRPTSINNANRISGGGGGGGSGGGATAYNASAGGAGGGGIGGSSGGAANGDGQAGAGGTLTAPGSGGNGGSNSMMVGGEGSTTVISAYGGTGGFGGTFGSSGNAGANGSGDYGGRAGGAGGAAGAAVSGNSNVTWIAVGTRNGGIS